jgi:GNAT superfamily N-acetyltransferase
VVLVIEKLGEATFERAALVARGQGVGHALVDAALTWAHDHGYQWVSVDFETANPLSRPFWLNAGFLPAGYGLLRLIDARR